MPVEGVALIPKCAECEATWLPVDEDRWQAWLTDDDPAEVVFYRPKRQRPRNHAQSRIPPKPSLP